LAYANENEAAFMQSERLVRLFRNGRNQAIRIPKEFELEGNEAIIHKEGNRLIIEPARKPGLLKTLSQMKPLEEVFSDVDVGLKPLDDVDL
jgi:antitoxin VapB